MGFWGSLWGSVKSAASTVASGVKKAVTYVKEKATNVWNSFSGKKTFEEAEQLYDEITERFNRKRREFDHEVDRITNAIEKHVKVINSYKARIKNELFMQMASNMSKIKDISINNDFTVEAYKAEVTTFDSLRSKNQLYLINFNADKFKTTIQAIFTLGFYTRKKAKETLRAVEEEELKVNAEISKMNAELVKLRAIEQSLKNVEHYFETLIDIYGQLLVRLDSSVKFLYYRCLQFAHKLVHKEMSIKYLPSMQQKEIEAIITASSILKVMTEAQIISFEDQKKVTEYEKKLHQQHDQVFKIYEVA